MNCTAKMNKVLTVLVSTPGTMQESLRAALRSLLRLEVVGSAGGGLSALNMVREQHPTLLVIDGNLPEDELLALLHQVKQEHPQIRCVVLIETTKQKPKVLSAGADAALLRGSAPEHLLAAMERVVASIQTDNE